MTFNKLFTSFLNACSYQTGIRNPSSVRLDDSGMYCGIVNGIP